MEKRIINTISCKNCSNTFQIKVTPTNLKIGNHQKFCSLSCSNSFNKTGEKNPMFGKESWSKGQTKESNNTIKKMAENKSGKNHHYYGQNLTEEHKNKIKNSLNNDDFKTQAKRPHKQKFKDKYSDSWEEHYNLFLKTMSNINSKEWFIEQYGEAEGAKKYDERIENLKQKSHFVTHPEDGASDSYSKISQDLFWELYKSIKNLFKKIYFAELNHEHSCYTGKYRFDFVIMDNKKIIEFNGNKFHPRNINEAELINWKTPHGIPGTIILERDSTKRIKAEKKGFTILYIWESEYKEDRTSVINKCLKFIGE